MEKSGNNGKEWKQLEKHGAEKWKIPENLPENNEKLSKRMKKMFKVTRKRCFASPKIFKIFRFHSLHKITSNTSARMKQSNTSKCQPCKTQHQTPLKLK